jgi:glyoxylase-like metal-dependent hydrolase (beta-lactamase superfamily II)
MNIVNVGYDSTNYYLLADKTSKLLIDIGFPGTLPKLQHQCKRSDVKLFEIPYLFSTHYHPDHAGLAGELQRAGIKLIVIESQLSAVPILRSYMKPAHHYVEIDLSDSIHLKLDDSRVFLARLGIKGEIISTPGHSDDSMTLILDEGAAFTGDLTHPTAIADDAILIRDSWKKVRSFGVKTVYPGHGPTWQINRTNWQDV